MRVSATPFSDPKQLAAIDALIAESPDQIGLQFGRACCLEDLGRIDDALAAYIAVLDRDATHFGGLTNLGSLLFERGRTNEARPYVEGAAKLYPRDPIALVNLAQLQSELGNADAAIATYDAVIAQKPDFLHAHLGLARIYGERGDLVRMQAHFDRAFTDPKAWNFPYRGEGSPYKCCCWCRRSAETW